MVTTPETSTSRAALDFTTAAKDHVAIDVHDGLLMVSARDGLRGARAETTLVPVPVEECRPLLAALLSELAPSGVLDVIRSPRTADGDHIADAFGWLADVLAVGTV